MKKKTVSRVLATFLASVSLFSVVGCDTGNGDSNGGGTPHVCSFTEKIVNADYKKQNATCTTAAEYYYACACGEKGTETYHFGEATGHSGGTATCTDKAECSVCGEEYGETPAGHTGGTATCTDKAECSVCGEEYGELKEHDFKSAWMVDAIGHWRVCITSGCTETNEKEEHYGGTATETERAVCEGCGAYYGGLASHTHHYDKKIPTNTYKVTDATCEEKATYYYACSCGKAGEETYENGDYAVCVDVDKNHVCDVCKQPVGQHVAGDSTHVCVYCGENVSDCADDNNDHHCDVCGEKLSEHTGGTATSTQKAVCAICGEEYGDLLHGVIVDETIPTSKIYRLGDYMYDFTITDCNGNSYTLSNVLETKKMVVLNFWASWCGPCQSEFPVMEQAYNTYKNEVEIFAISVDSYDTQEAVRGMGLDMPAFDGTNGRDVSSHFNISAIPVTVVIDRYGIVSYMHTGAMVTLSDWTTLFDMYIADDYTPANFVE